MSSVVMLGGSVAVPCLLLLWYVYARDQRPEPRGLLLKVFLLGAACGGVLMLYAMPAIEARVSPWATGLWGAALVKAFLSTALPEALLLFLLLRGYAWRQPAFDEPLDGVVYGVTASLGLVTMENIFYVTQNGTRGEVLSAIMIMPAHAFTGAVLGAFVGRAFKAHPSQRFGPQVAGLAWVVLLHGAYSTFINRGSDYFLLAFVVLFIEGRWARRLYKELQSEQRYQMVLEGVPSLGQEFPVHPMTAKDWEAWRAQAVASDVVGPRPPPPPPPRAFTSWLKLGLGGLGLSACGIWWLALFAVLYDQVVAGTASVPGFLGVSILSALPTWLCVALFRSGLSGPYVTSP